MSAEQIKAALERLIHEYGYERGDLCEQYARDQLRDKILALLPEASETVEWGVRVSKGDADYAKPQTLRIVGHDGRPAATEVVARWPETRTLVTRTRTTYAPTVTDWTEAAE